MNLTLDCSIIKATIGSVNFAARDNYGPHFTKIAKIWQDRSPIRKSSINLRFEKNPFIYYTRFCSILHLKISFTELAHSLPTQFLVSALSIITGISPLHRLEFRLFSWNFGTESEDGRPLIHTKIKKKNTNKSTNKNTTMIHTPANFFLRLKNLQRIVGYIRKCRIGILEYSKRKAEFA